MSDDDVEQVLTILDSTGTKQRIELFRSEDQVSFSIVNLIEFELDIAGAWRLVDKLKDILQCHYDRHSVHSPELVESPDLGAVLLTPALDGVGVKYYENSNTWSYAKYPFESVNMLMNAIEWTINQ